MLRASVLSRFPNAAFVETGSHEGDGIETAIRCGFRKIESIEISAKIAAPLIERFKNDPVTIHVGDSSKLLSDILDRYTTPCTIWLDAHGLWSDDADWIFPLFDELRQIKRSHHTILIDDLRLMSTGEFPITVEEVKELALKINPDYEFSYAPGFAPKDILICRP